ncbi:MAG: FtsX-like permease family protein [Acidimicrobiales bacterium]
MGDALTVTGSLGTEVFTLSGTVVFGVEESGVSPYFLLFDLPTMQRLLESPGQIDSASIVLGEGVSFDDVLPSIEASLPPGMVVADHRALVAEQNDEFGAVIDLIGNALLGFAIVTLFVSTFVIANTFAVLVGQQRQQMGLLRAIGAREGQATAVVVAEAGVVGGIASVLGLLGGVAVAEGIKALVESVTTGVPRGADPDPAADDWHCGRRRCRCDDAVGLPSCPPGRQGVAARCHAGRRWRRSRSQAARASRTAAASCAGRHHWKGRPGRPDRSDRYRPQPALGGHDLDVDGRRPCHHRCDGGTRSVLPDDPRGGDQQRPGRRPDHHRRGRCCRAVCIRHRARFASRDRCPLLATASPRCSSAAK